MKVLVNLGVIQLQQNDTTGALTTYRRLAYIKAPDNPVSWHGLRECYRRMAHRHQRLAEAGLRRPRVAVEQ